MKPLRPSKGRFSLCLVLTAVMAVPLTARAAETTYNFHLPSMDMPKGLNQLAATVHTPILFDNALIQGRRLPALKGLMSRDQALQAALVGTGLAYRLTETGVILVYRPQPSAGESKEKLLTQPVSGDDVPPTVVVTGIRKSLLSSSVQSQASAGILAVVVATDIGKLPDGNAAEAMQRIGGVQIQRDQGEGASVALRGLSQVNSQIDGRSIFTASSGRLLSFEDVPSELLAGINVYKTPSVDQIEGGLSGVVDLRLRKPFDFKGRRLAGQINATFYDNADKSRPQGSMLYSNRWMTPLGEMGLLVSGSYQTSAFRSDYVAGGAPTTRIDLVDVNHNGVTGDAADTIVTPQGGGVAVQGGTRLRQGFDGHFQWRPDASTEIHLDAFNYKFRTSTQGTLLFATGKNQYFYPGSGIILASGTNVFQGGIWSNLFLDSNAFNGGRTSDVSQIALGGKWSRGPLWLSGDVSYNLGHSFKTFYQLALSSNLPNSTTGETYGAAPQVFQDYSSEIPVFRISGIDLTNPANLVFDRAIQSVDWVHGSEVAGRVDGEYQIDRMALKSLSFGLRYSDRFTAESSVYQFDDLEGSPTTMHPELLTLEHLHLFGRGGAGDVMETFLTVSPDVVRNFGMVRAAFSLTTPSPSDAFLSTYRIRERVTAAYVMAHIDCHLGSVPVTGNAGIRLIETAVATQGMITSNSENHLPINLHTAYADVLPQLNLKAEITRQTTLRLSAYQTLTRQDFGLLAPQVQLDFLFHLGNAGNPNLRPLSATNLDMAVEHHDAENNSSYANLFFKRVVGFVQNEVHQETYFGQTFDVTRPQSGGVGKVWGAEVGITRFLQKLPDPLKGLGFQANYTYVNSVAPSPISTAILPLEGLSKHSFNLIGFYEHGPFSGRIAYNYRSPYVITSVTNGVVGFTSDWSQAQAVLDGSLSYVLTSHIKMTTEFANLGNLRSRSYYTDLRLKHNLMETDRRFTIGLRFTY